MRLLQGASIAFNLSSRISSVAYVSKILISQVSCLAVQLQTLPELNCYGMILPSWIYPDCWEENQHRTFASRPRRQPLAMVAQHRRPSCGRSSGAGDSPGIRAHAQSDDNELEELGRTGSNSNHESLHSALFGRVTSSHGRPLLGKKRTRYNFSVTSANDPLRTFIDRYLPSVSRLGVAWAGGTIYAVEMPLEALQGCGEQRHSCKRKGPPKMRERAE